MAVFEEASQNSHTEVTNRKVRGCQTLEKTGRDERIRTSDPLNPIYIRTIATTGFQQVTVARRGETRKITALSAPYTHPEHSYGDGTARPLLG